MDMTIESCRVYKGTTWEVCFVEGGRIYLSAEIVSANGLKEGQVLTRRQVAYLMYQQQYRKARERALYIIEAGDISFKCLYEKLEKNYSKKVSMDVCKKMVELGLVDDRKYGEKLAERYFEIKLFGYYRAKQEMRKKGVPDEIIEELCEEYADDSVERIERLIREKYARFLGDESGRRKAVAAITRMGHSYSDIKIAMKAYLDESEEFEE